jgi:hypothetical protein
MKSKLVMACLVGLLVANTYAQSMAPTDLPNFSVIGNFLGSYTEHAKSFDVKEIEISYQHYLYPSVKADVFTAFHKEGSGDVAFGLEEAFLTFSDVIGIIAPNINSNLGLGALVGKKRLGFGKLNSLHPEQWLYVDRPLATQSLLGGAEGLVGEGAQLNYLLPLPFFSQIEAGLWTVSAGHEHEEDDSHAHTGIEYENRVFNSRLWNGFELSQSQELEFGLNYMISNVTADESGDKIDVAGLDLTYNLELPADRKFLLKAEAYQAIYGDEGHERETQRGGFILGNLTLNKTYNAGVRYSLLGKHGDEGEADSQLSLMLTRQLTETSKFRLQYSINEHSDDMVAAQIIFGIGPHSHVLQ